MNRKVAEQCAQSELLALHNLSSDELAKFVKKPKSKWITGPDGLTYRLRISAVWDSRKENRGLSVYVSVDDGGWSSFFPIRRGYLRGPVVIGAAAQRLANNRMRG
jgi:hypothetical protein